MSAFLIQSQVWSGFKYRCECQVFTKYMMVMISWRNMNDVCEEEANISF